MLDQNMGLSNTKAGAPFSAPGGLERGGRRSGSMYLSLLGVRVDSKLRDPQERSTEAPTLCFQARPLSALAVAPEMKSPLQPGPASGALRWAGSPLNTRNHPNESPKLPGSCQVPSPGGGRESATPSPDEGPAQTRLGLLLPLRLILQTHDPLPGLSKKPKTRRSKTGREGAAWGNGSTHAGALVPSDIT